MSLNAYDLSAGLFIRGLTNLKMELLKAHDHVTTSGRGEATLLDAQLATDRHILGASYPPADLHMYTLAAQIHWAAEGSKLAITRLLGAQPAPAPQDEKSFADLYQRLDAAIAFHRGASPSDLESGLDQTIIIERPSLSMRSSGRQFLVAYAIPHFFYHVTTAYGILRNQGVQLRMSDFLGDWGSN